MSDQDTRGGYSGYRGDDHGVVLGYQTLLNDQTQWGVYAGHSQGSTRYEIIDARLASESWYVGGMGRWDELGQVSGLSLTVNASYGRTNQDIDRRVPLALGEQRMSGDFTQRMWGVGGELRYDRLSDNLGQLSPYARIQYAHLKQDGYQEQGTMALRVDGLSANSVLSQLGLEWSSTMALADGKRVMPMLDLGWRYQWGDDQVSTGSSFVGQTTRFRAYSVEQDRHLLTVGAGVTVLGTQGWKLNASYGADMGAHRTAQRIQVGVNVPF